jgi:hypothetical protein
MHLFSTTVSGQAEPTPPILVLGVGRSGTSLAAWTLERLGVHFGGPESMTEPLEGDNPRGFYEHAAISDLNERLLDALGGSWWRPPPLPAGWEHAPELNAFEREARELLERDFGGRPLWGWKDPRTSLTLPFWRRIVPTARFVVCLREPHAVVRSYRRHLERRGYDLSDEQLRTVWHRYTEGALLNTADDPRTLLFYAEYVAEPLGTLDQLGRFIGREVAAASSEVRTAVLRFVGQQAPSR